MTRQLLDFSNLCVQLLLLAALGVGALFFTQKTADYYQHIRQLRTGGLPITVFVSRTERTVVGKGTPKSRLKAYDYRAVFHYNRQERTIPLTKTDYNRLKINDSVQVLHHKTLDEFIPVNYPGDHRQLITPLIFWAVFIGSLVSFLQVRNKQNYLFKKHIIYRLHKTTGRFSESVIKTDQVSF